MFQPRRTIMLQPSRRQFATSALSLAAIGTLTTPSNAESLTPKMNEVSMPRLTTYLLFDGNCQEAMEFYKSCMGGDLTVMKVKDSPVKDQMPAFQLNKTINARLKSETLDISASDWLRPKQTRVRGNTVCLYLSGGTIDNLKSLFEKLSVGAQVTDPLTDQFFGIYGALNDRFGVRWMFQTAKENL
jgi:PhnB protein